jgi:hypothetical protein
MNDSLLWADVGHRIAPPLPAVETPRSPLLKEPA